MYTPRRHIHSTSQRFCSDEKCKQNYISTNCDSKIDCDSEIDCDLESDWMAVRNDVIKKYKYWEVPVNDICMDSHEGPSHKATVNCDGDENAREWNECMPIASQTLTHTDQTGKLNMVDVGDKSDTTRSAVATGSISLGKEAFYLVKENRAKKGDVLTVAKIAGITGAKRTSDLIPLCHNIPLSKVDVDLELIEHSYSIRVTCLAKTFGKTGVEMEAITAVAMATITIYDMCKAVTKSMVIGDIKLLHKSGGKSGDYNAVK